MDEFHRVYNKNIDLIEDSDQRDVQTYLDLFINYKLKLAEAYSLDLHKENTYLKELNKYAKQLQNSYLTDKETEEKFLKEAYERTKYEVKVSHVLIRHSELDKDSIKEPEVSKFDMECFFVEIISPVSSPSFICLIEIPVSLSPA